MTDLRTVFEERLKEIDSYLDLLDDIQAQVGSGPRQAASEGLMVTVQQQRILHSSVYLQLYNLVESTITRCIDAVSDAASSEGRWRPRDLSSEVRRQWVKSLVRADEGLGADKQLAKAHEMCDFLVEDKSVTLFRIGKGGGGNWDDTRIEEFSAQLGLPLNIPPDVRTEIRRRRRNDKGALGLIRALRNDLAHGKLSFEECGADDTVSDLRSLRNWTAAYLREVVAQFELFVREFRFLIPGSRPTGATA